MNRGCLNFGVLKILLFLLIEINPAGILADISSKLTGAMSVFGAGKVWLDVDTAWLECVVRYKP